MANNPMPAIIEDFKDEVDKQFEQSAIRLWEQLVAETRSRAFETGTLRHNWNAQYNEPDKSAKDRPEPPAPSSVEPPNRPQLNGSLSDGDTVIYISNWTPYAGWVNDGDGGQEPANFLEAGIKGWKDDPE